ncbi:hypothetical protein MJM28_27670, partial [Salmonella enterica subsp. enterica serovar Montevideo]|nr:hypothetical protein [Salmonella enterica subsp. enterica serovar Montevideo]
AAIQYASAFASLAVEQVGASSMPQHLQVLHRMRTQSNKVINIMLQYGQHAHHQPDSHEPL